MGLPSAARNAFKFSGAAYVFSSLLLAFLPDHHYVQTSMGRFLLEQIIFYMGTLAVFLCWELSHHLHQVSACRYTKCGCILMQGVYMLISFLIDVKYVYTLLHYLSYGMALQILDLVTVELKFFISQAHKTSHLVFCFRICF